MNPLAERRQDASFLNSYSAWEKKNTFLWFSSQYILRSLTGSLPYVVE